MIDENKLIEEFRKKNKSDHNNLLFTFEGIKNTIKAQPKADWIPCEERLPNGQDNNINDSKISIPVLVQYKDYTAEPEVLHYNIFTKKFCYDQKDLTNEVLAWMPLPKKYKKEGEIDD